MADRGGYSAAARELGVAQATVSYHVDKLEQEFEATLVHFERRELKLTAVGHELYRTARMMLRAEEDLRRSVQELVAGREGRLRVGASIAFEQQGFFDDVVGPFVRRHPELLLSLRFGHSRALAQDVVDGVLDLAYVMDWSLPAQLPFEELHRARLCFFVPDRHPLTVRRSVTVRDITEEGLITAPLSDLEYAPYYQLLRERGFSDLRPRIEIDGVLPRVLATRAGLGVLATFRPDHHAGEPFEGLVPVRVEGQDVAVRVGVLRRTAGGRPESAEEFARWLREVCLRQ